MRRQRIVGMSMRPQRGDIVEGRDTGWTRSFATQLYKRVSHTLDTWSHWYSPERNSISSTIKRQRFNALGRAFRFGNQPTLHSQILILGDLQRSISTKPALTFSTLLDNFNFNFILRLNHNILLIPSCNTNISCLRSTSFLISFYQLLFSSTLDHNTFPHLFNQLTKHSYITSIKPPTQ